MRCRNSGGYGRWLFGIVDTPIHPYHKVSTKAGHVHTAWGRAAAVFASLYRRAPSKRSAQRSVSSAQNLSRRNITSSQHLPAPLSAILAVLDECAVSGDLEVDAIAAVHRAHAGIHVDQLQPTRMEKIRLP